MSEGLVVTPGGYRPRELVHKLSSDRTLRVLTGRLQGLDASKTLVADYGSVPRDGGNPALTPGYDLPLDADIPMGSEPAPAFGRGWIAHAHWTNETGQPISSFRTTWTVPPEPESRSGQTIFLFGGMQDSIPMALLPALQWGPSAAGGGAYWSVASWYVGGTTGPVFHGDLVRVSVGDELTGVITLTERRREHCDYRCGFDGITDMSLPIYNVRQLTRCGLVLAAYGIKQCSDYPREAAIAFRDIDLTTGFTHPAVEWEPVNAITDCGQHVVVLSSANPGGEVDVHFLQIAAEPELQPEDGETDTAAGAEELVAEELLVAAAVAPDVIEILETQSDVAPAEPTEAAAAPAEATETVSAPIESAEVVAAPAALAVPTEPVAVPAAPAVTVATGVTPIEIRPVEPWNGDGGGGFEPGRLVAITINNYVPATAGIDTIEAKLVNLEAAIFGFVRTFAPNSRPDPGAPAPDDLTVRLERLARLKAAGVLTDGEFTDAKSRVIGG